MKQRDDAQNKQLLWSLTDYCRWGNIEYIRECLDEHPDIDITYDNGCFFGLAIVVKTDSPEMLELLIDYYKKTRMQGDPCSLEYRDAREKLLDILAREGNWPNVAPDIQKVLDEYLKEDETDMEFDPADFGASEPPSDDDIEEAATASAHDSDHCLPLTEDNLKILEKMNGTSTDDESLGNKIATPVEVPHNPPAESQHQPPASETAACHPLPPATEAQVIGADANQGE